MNEDGWYVTDGGNSDTYSSLIGIPMVSTDESKFIDYVMRVQSPYLSLNCSVNTTVKEGPGGLVDKALPGLVSNATSAGSLIYWNVPNWQSGLNSSQNQRNKFSPDTTSPLTIKYVPNYLCSNFTLTCNVAQSYVEVEIRCPTSSTCASSKIRRSKLDHFPPAWTYLDLSWRTLPLVFGGMLANFKDGRHFYPQLFDRYLSYPNLMNSNYANVSQTTEDKATIRLGQMLNA